MHCRQAVAIIEGMGRPSFFLPLNVNKKCLQSERKGVDVMQDEAGACMILAEVKGCTERKKLLFRLVTAQGEIAILLKQKGSEEIYYISVFDLLEPFVSDIEKLRECTHISLEDM